MLTSLPPLAHHTANIQFHRPPNPQLFTSNSSHGNNPNSLHRHAQPGSQHQNQYQSQQPTRTLLSVLRADEHAILLRRASIGRFGAAWLRPAGVAKTLQGFADESAEREEAEGAASREYTLADTQTLPDDDLPSTTGSRDLDDDVPDADEEGEGGWIDEEDDEEDGHDVQGHPHDLHHAHEVPMVMMGMDADEDGDYAQGERDLDDDIPEGMEDSYQHTDTDVEDESTGEDAEVEVHGTVLDNSVWGSGTGGTIGGAGGNLPDSGETRGAVGRRSGARMPGREN